MVSFDVVSLFTSIPRTLASTTIRELLLKDGMPEGLQRLNPDEVLELLGYALRTIFTFDGQQYEQIRGTPMGSPVSGVIAEAVLQKLENVVLPISKPRFWTRYVDDTFVIVRRDQRDQLQISLNSVFPEIQFTMEEEKDGHLPFLDVLVSRNADGTLETTVFRKQTHTDNLLHAESNHPVQHKMSALRTLFQRVETHCSTPAAKQQETNTLLRMCRSNGYSKTFINRCMRNRVDRAQPHPRAPETRWCSAPYLHSTSEAVARLLTPYGLRLAHKPAHTIRTTLMRPKDPLTEDEKTGLIYCIPCNDCDKVYIGETDRQLQTRVKEHQGAVRRRDLKSLIFEHSVDHGHKFAFDQARAIDRARTRGGRLFKEAWHSRDNAINRHVGLHPAYKALQHRTTGEPPEAEETSDGPVDEQPPTPNTQPTMGRMMTRAMARRLNTPAVASVTQRTHQ